MKLKNWLEDVGLASLKINAHFAEMEWKPQNKDRLAAWDLYVEMITRIVTQPLPAGHGDEKTALDSVVSLFPTTREVLRRHGPGCVRFTQIAVVVLNQVVRPFTANWHRLSLAGAFQDKAQCDVFRQELALLQVELRIYTRALANLAGVEDLTTLEQG